MATPQFLGLTNRPLTHLTLRFRCSVQVPRRMSKRDKLLLSRRSLETSPPQLREPLAYVLHLRSYWRPEGRAQLVIPASWKEFSAFADSKCGVRCVADRCCLFRNVRFDGDTETRLVASGEELPRDIVSQLLTNVGMDDCLATCLPRAFEGIPRTKLRSNTRQNFSQTASRLVDFELVPEHGNDGAKDTGTSCLLLGVKEPTQMPHPIAMSFDSYSGSRTLVSIPEELASQGQTHLRLLASSIKSKVVGAESFPEWLVLFGLVYGAHHVRIVAYVPYHRTWDVMECTAHIVDEVSLPSITGVPTCELALEHLRLLLVLTTLRRHVYHLSKSLITTMDSCDGVRRTNNPFLCCPVHDQHNLDDSESLNRCLGSGQHCSPECSTCTSSLRTRGPNILECGKKLSWSCGSFTSSVCSTCLSSPESTSTCGSLHTEDSKHTNSGYMEPSTISLSPGGPERVLCPHKLTETKVQEITAWARQIVPTEHPVRDTYRMVVYHPTDSISG